MKQESNDESVIFLWPSKHASLLSAHFGVDVLIPILTDGIYPGKYTYQDYVSEQKMAEVCMSNYDPNFAQVTGPGDIVVGGFNFGCGSSREQAATCILAVRLLQPIISLFEQSESTERMSRCSCAPPKRMKLT